MSEPISEEDLKEMEAAPVMADGYMLPPWQVQRLIAEVRRLRQALGMYGMPACWSSDAGAGIHDQVWEPPTPELRNEPGWVLARKALGWSEPSEPCENPSCDGVANEPNHRCFKDGRWLDDGSEM